MAQRPPQRFEALDREAENPATIIFLHGFGDDAEGWISECGFLMNFGSGCYG